MLIAERLGVDPAEVDVSPSYEVDWELIRTSVPNYEVRVELARAVTAAQATQGECRIHGYSQTTQVFPVLDSNGAGLGVQPFQRARVEASGRAWAVNEWEPSSVRQ